MRHPILLAKVTAAMKPPPKATTRRRAFAALVVAAAFVFCAGVAAAHPLGNFTINHYARIEVGGERVQIRYVVDMAEISALQELQKVDADGDGTPSRAELDAYLESAAARYAEGLRLFVDGARVPLSVVRKEASTPPGEGNLPTLRVECELVGVVPFAGGARHLQFEIANHSERIGWREIVVAPARGVTVFDSTAYGNGLTEELRAYPKDRLAAPLDERRAELSFVRGEAPAGAALLRTRDGRPAGPSRDLLAELITVQELTPLVALFGLLLAAGLGAAHALSPGHGKTVVGAYLVGSRGTARHAAFLGLTVTVTHTAGVFALGLLTLFASQYVVPERLFPVLSVVSGALILIVGLTLFVRRLRAALGPSAYGHEHTHDHEHPHSHAGAHGHTHTHGGQADGPALVHSHGGSVHSHLPPGGDGGGVTWRSLLALGVSGGLLPCPSALVVLLAAVSLGRVGYGLLLVVAFSVGLATTLTTIGLVFVYAGRFLSRATSTSRLVRVLPVVSAFVIACVGAALCYQALGEAGLNIPAALGLAAGGGAEPPLASLSAAAVLGLGLVFGLKHATEVDHVVAVSAIVSEQRNLLRAALVGGLWGVGHTASLFAVGVVVLVLRVAIPERVGDWLEFGVALMIVGLGSSALVRALRSRGEVHIHLHRHDGFSHTHIHFHDEHDAEHAAEAAPHSHAVRRVGLKPLVVGAVHGLAGSAALTLLVLTQIGSTVLGLLYLLVFGLGSIAGMLLMSGLVGLPFVLGAHKLGTLHRGLQTVVGGLSIVFGLWYAYETGIAGGLLAFI
jgi:ABC-type nickel/cobalt efflux system permease component RcnA